MHALLMTDMKVKWDELVRVVVVVAPQVSLKSKKEI